MGSLKQILSVLPKPGVAPPFTLDEREQQLQKLDLSEGVTIVRYAAAFGGCANIYCGRLAERSGDKAVALKCFRKNDLGKDNLEWPVCILLTEST